MQKILVMYCKYCVECANKFEKFSSSNLKCIHKLEANRFGFDDTDCVACLPNIIITAAAFNNMSRGYERVTPHFWVTNQCNNTL